MMELDDEMAKVISDAINDLQINKWNIVELIALKGMINLDIDRRLFYLIEDFHRSEQQRD